MQTITRKMVKDRMNDIMQYDDTRGMTLQFVEHQAVQELLEEDANKSGLPTPTYDDVIAFVEKQGCWHL